MYTFIDFETIKAFIFVTVFICITVYLVRFAFVKDDRSRADLQQLPLTIMKKALVFIFLLVVVILLVISIYLFFNKYIRL